MNKKMRIALDEGAFVPESAHVADAGYDMRTPVDFVVPARGSAKVDTGVHFEIPNGVCGTLWSKSGLNVKFDNVSTGLIDSEYTGSVVVKLYNLGDTDKEFKKGDKISQIVFLPMIKYEEFEVVDRLDNTDRGEGGFGSTGR